MPIQIGAKGLTIAGVAYPRYTYIDWLAPNQEADAVQGGDAFYVPKRGFTPAEEAAIRAVVPVTTVWANRDAMLAAGITTCLFSDVGIGGTVRSYSGGRWRTNGGEITLKNLIVRASNNTNVKTVLDYCPLLAGLLLDGDSIEVDFAKEKTGGTADTDNTDLCIGTSALVVGSTLWDGTNGLSNGLATTNLVLRPTPTKYRRESATTMRPGAPIGGAGNNTATAANLVKTVPNMDTQPTFLQITSRLTTAAGEVAWLNAFVVKLIEGS